MELQAGQKVSSPQATYEIIAPLGKGGFGVTWRARREADGREVVVKQLRLERVGDWKAVELFEREARVLQGLQHARIPACTDFFHQADQCFLVQSLVPGQPMSALLREGRRLDRGQMMRWFTDVLEVLVYLHGRTPPVIHRDINPKNIILEPNGTASLIDFGAVQAALSSGSSVASTSAGTFGYAPAEQFVGRATPQSDLYGLAMTFLAIQTGQEPERLVFAQGRVQVRESLKGHDVDARIVLVLEQMTEPDPERRPRSAAEVLDRLRGVQQAAQAPRADAGPLPQLAAEGKIDWQAARAVAQQLGQQGAWFAPPPFPLADVERAEVSADGSAVALVCYEGVYLWHLPTQRVHALVRDSISSRRAGFSPDGRVIVIADHYNERIHVAEIGADGTPQVRKVSGKVLKQLDESDLFISVSPDRSSALLGFEDTWGEKDNIALVELGKGNTQAVMKAKCELGMGFSPDGQAILCVSDDDKLRVYGADGSHEDHPYRAFAMSPDGRTAAYAKEDDRSVTLASVESVYPLKLKRLRDVALRQITGLSGEDEERYEIERLRFSPDSARLAIEVNSLRKDVGSPRDTSWGCELVVAEVASGQATHLILDPHSADRRFGDLHSFAFSPDSQRLIVGARFGYGRYSGVTHVGALLFQLGAGGQVRFIGVLSALNHAAEARSNVFFNGQAVAPGRHGNVVIGEVKRSIDGEDVGWGDDDGDGAEDEDGWGDEEEEAPQSPEQQELAAQALAMFAGGKGDRQDKELPFMLLAEGFFCRLDRDGPIGAAQRAPYEDQELVRGVLAGKPLDAYLPPEGRAALQDVLLRRRVFEGMLWREQLKAEGSWAGLVDATRGVTHLIPHIIREAARGAAQRPRFGQQQASGGADRLLASSVLEVASQVASRSAEEQAALFDLSGEAIRALDAQLAAPPRVYPRGRQPGASGGKAAKAAPAAASGGAMVASGGDAMTPPAASGGVSPVVLIMIVAAVLGAVGLVVLMVFLPR